MSTPTRRGAAAQRALERRRQEARRARRRRAFAVIGAVVLVFGVLVALRLAGVGEKKSKPTGALDPGVMSTVESVPASAFAAVGGGTAKDNLIALPGPTLTKDGKPKIVYVGAEYCPFCAAERWGLVVALSRFGTWSNLSESHSAADDVFPNTPTFSFHGAGYTSDHVAFEGVETNTNERVGGTYAPLDTLTPEQTRLLEKYDAPPYVPKQSAGGIPFLDLGDRYMSNGASYSPELLANRSMAEIAKELKDPSSEVAKAVLGSANQITAAICALTNDEPASVCTAAPIPALKAQLPHD